LMLQFIIKKNKSVYEKYYKRVNFTKTSGM
jgi:hypothetical protein